MREVGNRRSDEELEKLKIENNRTAFKLKEQTDFKGSDKQLEFMQDAERAYISGHPIMTDEEWDILKNKYGYQETLASVSPSGRSWIKFESPLPSLNKGGSFEDLRSFLSKFPKNQTFIVENKLDGLTANLKYIKRGNCYIISSISSRGNGRYGLALNPFALSGVDVNYPYKISSDAVERFLGSLPNKIEFRGEAVIPKNSHTRSKYGENPVWRNIASGMFNRIIPANLKGLFCCMSDTENSWTSFPLTLNGSYEGRKAKNPEEIENMRLICSLFLDKMIESGVKPTRGFRNDSLTINCDRIVTFTNSEGKTFEWNSNEENECLDIVIYSMSVDGSNVDIMDSSILSGDIESLGFKSIKNVSFENGNLNYDKTFRITSNIDDIWNAVCDFYGCDKSGRRDLNRPRLRNLYEYACDGVVIKPFGSDKDTQNVDLKIGRNSKIIQPEYPEDQIAIKLLSEVVRVKLDKIEQSSTELGNVVCIGILDKEYVTESGAKVSRVNLHNPEWLQSNDWIKEGNEYDMIMSLDIIPVLLKPDIS